MNLKQRLSLSLGLLFFWLLMITVLSANLHIPINLFADKYDRLIYFERGLWFPRHQIPFQDTVSEYPQIPTYLFGLMHIVVQGESHLNTAYWKYLAFFSLLMLTILVATIELLYRMLPSRRILAYLLLLPAPLYFVFSRFDILPAFLTLLSYKMIMDKKWNVAAFLLGVGALTKWYPALLLPAYLVYYYRTAKRIPWRMVVTFVLTCFIIVVPTWLAGGLDAVAVPYRFHLERELETVSLPTLVSKVASFLSGGAVTQSGLSLTFLLLQISMAPLSFFSKIDKPEKLLNWCILIISVFMLFSRIYSPQWLLWIFPLCILSAQSKIDIVILILYGTITYLEYPIIWDYFGTQSIQMTILGLINVLFLVIIGINAAQRVQHPALKQTLDT